MKPPKYIAATRQHQHDACLNPFAIELLAESFADPRNIWGEETVCVIGWGKDRKPVYICLSRLPPEGVEAPEGSSGGDLEIGVRLRERPEG